MENPVFAVLGGDARQGYLATLLAAEGYTVFAAGFETKPELAQGSLQTNALTAASMARVAILPIMPTNDGAVLNAEYAQSDIPLDESLCDALSHARIYTGFADRLRGISRKYAELDIHDYMKQETLLIKNAQITAEATLMLAIEKMPKAMYESNCLITGYGRIGKALVPLIKATGAQVTVAARRPEDFARIEVSGVKEITYSMLPSKASSFDLVVNTADALVLGEAFIRNMDGGAVVIDVASKPGGTDFEAARRCKVTALHALGLPGKYAPLTAARIIKDTVLEMMEEEHS